MDTDAAVVAKVKDCLRKGNKLFKAKAVINHVSYSKAMKGTFGSAGWNEPTGWYVKLNLKQIQTNLDFMLEEIIPHEVAHIVSMWLGLNDMPHGDVGHGEGWKTVAKALGSSGERQAIDPSNPLYPYKNEKGQIVHVNQNDHDVLQNQYKVLRDPKGNRITAAGYQGIKKAA